MGREGVRETSLGPVTLETISEAEGRDIRSGDCVPLSVSYGSKCYDLADVWGGGRLIYGETSSEVVLREEVLNNGVLHYA